MRKILVPILLITLLNIPLLVTTSLSINEKGDDGLQDSPWPMFSHDEKHTGFSSYDTSSNKGGQKWKFNAYESVTSSPVIDKDGVIYVGASN